MRLFAVTIGKFEGWPQLEPPPSPRTFAINVPRSGSSLVAAAAALETTQRPEQDVTQE